MNATTTKPLTDPMKALVARLLLDTDVTTGIIDTADWHSGLYPVTQQCALVDRGIVIVERPMTGPFRLNRNDLRVQAVVREQLRAAEAEEGAWGFECENCKAESPAAVGRENRERLAGNEGWGMGLLNGEAFYACSNCLPGYDAAAPFQSDDSLKAA